MRRVFCLLAALVVSLCVYAQSETTSASIEPMAMTDVAPSDKVSLSPHGKGAYFPIFGPFHDNYILTGIPVSTKITRNTADAVFQISAALRLWNIKGKTDVLFTYTQRSFWDIYAKSCPFHENNFNPGLWFATPASDKVLVLCGIEHESNGRDGTGSRSWNYATLACLWSVDAHWRLGVRAWVGYYDTTNSPNWFRYRGLFNLWARYHTLDDLVTATLVVNPTHNFRNYNLQGELSVKLSRRRRFVPSLFVQYRGGYAENLLDYNRYRCSIRIGIGLTNDRLGLY